MDLKSIPQYKNALETILVTWESVKQTKKQAIVLLEAPSGMKKTEIVLQFLKDSQAIFIRSRGTHVPSPYLPFHIAYQSIFSLNQVQKLLTASNPDQLAIEEQRLLKAIISSTAFLQFATVPDVARSHHWQTSYQRSFEQDTNPEEEDQSTLIRPITLPNRLAITLSELAITTPFVFFLDDLDLIDSASLEALVRELLPVLQSLPVLFLFAFGSTSLLEKDHPLLKFIENAKINFSSVHLTLHPLQEEYVKKIVTTEFADYSQQITDDLIAKIFYSAAGNLAQLQDTLNWLRQRYIKENIGFPKEIPNHDDLMNEQFSQLSQLQQEILCLASCQGRYFCAEVVANILTRSLPLVLESLDQMSSEDGWVRADSDLPLEDQIYHWYRFRGRKRYEWTYEAIPEAQLCAYHRQTGQALETIYGKFAKDIADLLAYQFEKAKDFVKAAEYFNLLANQANHQGDAVSAQVYAEKGLKYLGNNKNYQELICHLAAEQGKAYQRSEKAHLAIDILQEARKLATKLDFTGELIVDIEYHLGQALLDSNRWESGMEMLSRAIDQALAIENWLRVAEISESRRPTFYRRGDEGFLIECDRVIDLLRKQSTDSSRVAIAEILEDKGWFYLERREIESAIKAFSDAFDAIFDLTDPYFYPEIFYKLYYQQASALRFKGQHSLALENAENAINWAVTCRRRDYEANGNMIKAIILDSSGDLENAELTFEKALTLLDAHPNLHMLAQVAEMYGLFLSQTGRKARALEQYQVEYQCSIQLNNYRQAQVARNDMAAIHKHLGGFSEALATYQQLLNEGIAQQDIARQIVSLNHIGDIYRVQGNLVESANCHLRAIQLSNHMSKLGSKFISLRYLMRNYLVSLNYIEANNLLEQMQDLRNKNVGTNRDYYRSQIYEYRLACHNSNLLQGVAEGLVAVAESLKATNDLLWVGLTSINLGLCHLLLGQHHAAINQAQYALNTLKAVESWQVSDAHLLLARGYLAIGNLAEAKTEVTEAKTCFMKLKLFHCVTQAEIIETDIEIAQESVTYKQWQEFAISELEQTFRYTGI